MRKHLSVLIASLFIGFTFGCDKQDEPIYSSTATYEAKCPAGYEGSPITKIEQATSTISQLDAEEKALSAAKEAAEEELVCNQIVNENPTRVGTTSGSTTGSSTSGTTTGTTSGTTTGSTSGGTNNGGGNGNNG